MKNEACPKCGLTSGDDWQQCEGRCPLPESPYFSLIEKERHQGRPATNNTDGAALLPVTAEDIRRAEDWATMIGRMGGVILDQSQRRGLASQFAAHRLGASGGLEEFVRHKRNCGAEHLDFDLPCDCGLDKILAALPATQEDAERSGVGVKDLAAHFESIGDDYADGKRTHSDKLNAAVIAASCFYQAAELIKAHNAASSIGALVEGLHAQIFGVHSLGDPSLSHAALADGGQIHEAAHALIRALPIHAAPQRQEYDVEAVREALVNAKYALEYWERESKAWSDSRVPGARPGWMAETRRRGREEIARIDRRLAALAHPAQARDEMREALERIADPRNTHFAGDAQVVARDALAALSSDKGEER